MANEEEKDLKDLGGMTEEEREEYLEEMGVAPRASEEHEKKGSVPVVGEKEEEKEEERKEEEYEQYREKTGF